MDYDWFRLLSWYELPNKKEKAHIILDSIKKRLCMEYGDLTKTNFGISISYQYFYTSTVKEGKKPRITVCYINTPGASSIGFSICSMNDEPDKLVGQTIALGRASRAMLAQENTHPVGSDTVNLTFMSSDFDYCIMPSFKGMYMPYANSEFRYHRLHLQPLIS